MGGVPVKNDFSLNDSVQRSGIFWSPHPVKTNLLMLLYQRRDKAFGFKEEANKEVPKTCVLSLGQQETPTVGCKKAKNDWLSVRKVKINK